MIYDHRAPPMTKRPATSVPLIGVDRKSAEPLHRQVYESYRGAVLAGRLRPGQMVPSTRALALELQISRMPVLTAYAQLLAEGYFETRAGIGTVISEGLPVQRLASRTIQPSAPSADVGPRIVASRCLTPYRPFLPAWISGRGAFNVGAVALEHFPHRTWTRLVTRSARNGAGIGSARDVMGSLPLREAIADYLRTSRAVNCVADQIMITNGSQNGVELTVRALLDPGSPVWVEEPGYQLARDVLSMAGCRIVPVPVDQQGIDVARGIKLSRNARAAFVTPSHQFPLGMTMSVSRRLELLAWASKQGAWIIEDDYDGEFRYESKQIASLQGLDRDGRVIYIGTFSKVLSPALRIGYVVIPRDLLPYFMRVRWATDLGSEEFIQGVVTDFLREGHFARHLRSMRILYRERRSVLVEALERSLGSEAQIVGAEAGLHLVLLPKGLNDDVEPCKAAALEQLWLWPLSQCYYGPATEHGFVLGFGGTPPERIPKAVKQLKEVLRGRRQASLRPARP